MSNINDLPPDQRPREKLANKGAASLSDAELLAIFLRVGVKGQSAIEIGQRLIQTYGNLSQLSRLSLADLAKEYGLGLAKAAQLCASFEIANRIAQESLSAQPITSAKQLYEAMVNRLRNQSTEGLYVILVNSKLHHIRTIQVSQGTVNATISHPRDILQPVIQHNAYGFFLIHNHPSGDPTPSRQDIEVTQNVNQAADLMQVRFLDHVIIGQIINNNDPYYSFREHGKM